MRITRPVLVSIVALLLVLVAALAAHQVALQKLRGRVLEALGPRASVDEVRLGWSGVVLTGLRIKAPEGWPAEDELRARSVIVIPEVSSWWGVKGRVQHVSVDGAYLSMLRQKRGGVKLVPALFEEQPLRTVADDNAPAREAHIDRVVFTDSVIEFYDASVRGSKPHLVRITAVEGTVDDLKLPTLDEPMQLDLRGRFDGRQRDGAVTLKGPVTPKTRDAALDFRMQGVDLVALQPYLLTFTDGGVKRGTMDLALDARVQRSQLRAPGTVVVHGLELNDNGSMLGVPRAAVLASLQRGDRIELKFTIEGRLDDPKFSLNESFAREFAAGLANALGVTIGGVAEGIGNVIKGLFGR